MFTAWSSCLVSRLMARLVSRSASRSASRHVAAVLLAATLAACGGGGGGPAVCIPGVSTMAFPNGCPGDNLAGSASATATIGLALLDAGSKLATNSVTPSQPGELRVTLKDATGKPVRDTAVTFATTDSSGAFVPSSGTALSNDSGVATVRLAAGSRAGAFTVTGSANVAGSALKTTVDYAVSFPVLSLGPLVFPASPFTLSAGGNAEVSVTVLSGGVAYTAPLLVSFTSPCIVASKATMGPPVYTSQGVAKTQNFRIKKRG